MIVLRSGIKSENMRRTGVESEEEMLNLNSEVKVKNESEYDT